MTSADFAKSWSVMDFIAKRLGKNGQEWLRAGCLESKNKKTFLTNWRAVSEALFDVQGGDVYKVLEGRWRKYAESQVDVAE